MSRSITVGIDPHREMFTASVLDERGRRMSHEHFTNNHRGHAEVLQWAQRHGDVDRFGIEGASGLGRPLAEFLVGRGVDVRDVPAHRTAHRQRGRHEGKTDLLDAHRIAAETQTNDALACAFKQAEPAAPDSVLDQISLWHNARTSLRKIRVQLIGELDSLIHDLPESARHAMPARTSVRARINAIAELDRSSISDPVQLLRLDLIDSRIAMLRDVLVQDKAAAAQLATLVEKTGSTLTDIPGIATRAAA
jgi:transposase